MCRYSFISDNVVAFAPTGTFGTLRDIRDICPGQGWDILGHTPLGCPGMSRVPGHSSS
jgi:hypothetical protein